MLSKLFSLTRLFASVSLVAFGLSFFGCARNNERVPSTMVQNESATSQAHIFSPLVQFVTASPQTAQFVTNQMDTRKIWLHRVARLLRAGVGLEDINLERDLLLKSETEALDYLMSQPEFSDAVLDFNLHFLGFRKDHVRESDGELNSAVFDFPSALSSAIAVLNNGNFLKLLEFKHPLYMAPLRFPVPLESGDSLRTPEEVRKKQFAKVNGLLDEQIQEIVKNPKLSMDKACSRFMKDIRQGYLIGDTGISFSIMDIVYGSNIWFGKVVEACIGPFKPDSLSNIEQFLNELREIRKKTEIFFAKLSEFEIRNYSTKDLRNIRDLKPELIDLPFWHTFGNPHRQSLQNSSTNFNRKRAAYVLSRYFCDDLTPINVEPSEGSGGSGGGRHATETACMACHYKLDPIAGFFRDYGMNFGNYQGHKQIRFDDNAGADLENYQKSWLAPSGSSRKWNVGFIRSSNRDNLNVYGSSIEDLFSIIQSEPEVKRCLVKRMLEYYVSDQQVFDRGYLEMLTQEFIELAKQNSTVAFKEVTKKILLSNSFKNLDPQTDKCYDYPPNFNPNGTPPCQVSYILTKNCANCHYDKYEEPYLDLTGWAQMEDGTFNFPHLDQNGKQKKTSETFEKILFRLTTTDSTKRMPRKSHMDALELETLFKWVNGVLTPPTGEMNIAAGANVRRSRNSSTSKDAAEQMRNKLMEKSACSRSNPL